MKTGTDFQSFYLSLDGVNRETIDRVSKNAWIHTDSILINQGSPSESVYIIESGVVEVLVETPDNTRGTPLTYLGPGDIIGELGILNQEPRSATIRSVVDVYFREISRNDFMELLANLPGFGLYIALRLAERLANKTANLAYNSCCVDLSGKIPPFDLAAILCTIQGSYATGELKVLDSSRTMLGTFFIREATLEQARYLHLQGLEAFWQMFLEPNPEGAFSFRRCSEPSRPVDPDFLSDAALNALLFEAAVKKDHFSSLNPALRMLNSAVAKKSMAKSVSFSRQEKDSQEKAEQVWDLLNTEPQTLHTLWSRSNLSHFTLSTILQQLIDEDSLELLPD
jgi:CRP/FNR family transcriptional regulator, cyclic AMP receptor protein